jgi:hypothetical protein
MKSTLKNLLTFALLAIIISSCGGKKASLLIPENAGMVLHIDAASLSSKLSWEEIKNSDWFKMANEKSKADEFERKLMENPENSGVDMKSDLYLFMAPSGNNSYGVVQGKIKDLKAFEELVKKMSEGKEIKKDGDMSYAGESDGIVTWTSDKFMLVGEGSNMNSASGFGEYKGKSSLTQDSLIKYAKGLYGLKGGNSIAGNSNFMSMLNDKGDMHVWIGSSLTSGALPKQLSMLNSSVMKGNSTAMTINFENGKIAGTAKSYYNKELTDLYKKYQGGNLNTDMLKKIPGDNVSAVIALNYQPEGLKAFLKLLGVDGLADGFISQAGITLDEVIAANKGDLLLAITDFTMKEREVKIDMGGNEPFVHKTSAPDVKVLFATSIGNKGAFDKLIATAQKAIADAGDRAADAAGNIKYEVKDNWFIAGNSQENVTAYGSGTKDHAFISKISGHPMGVYINIKKIIEGVDVKNLGGFGKAEMTMLTGNGNNIWEDIVMYGGELKDGATTSHFEVNLVDKNVNSLKQLNGYFSTIAKNAKSTFEGMDEMDFPAMDSPAVRKNKLPPLELRPAQ